MAWIRRHPVAAFLTMVYLVTVATSLVSALTRRDLLPYDQAPYDLIAHLVGSAVPALIVTAAVAGRAGIRDLWQRCLRWRVGLGWYVMAVVVPTILTVALAAALEGGRVVAAVADNWPKLLTFALPSLLFAFVFSNLFEEIGWTGFLFNRLQDRHHPLKAATIVWIPFALAHIPGFLVEGGSLVDGLTITAFLLIPQLASRIIVAWFYNNTMRSLWIVGLFHSSYNVTTRNEFRETFLPVADDVQLLLYLAIPIVPALLIAVLTKWRLSYQEPVPRPGRP
jgi:uncharacterized protein